MSLLALFKKKSPVDKLLVTKATLYEWIRETIVERDNLPEDELFRMDLGDSIAAWTIQVALIDELLVHPEQCTANGLEDMLRIRFARRDEIDGALELLPCFDEPEDELDYERMDSAEREQRRTSHALHDEAFTIDRECDLLARFAGISERRISDIKLILGGHNQDEGMRKLSKKAEAASYYPMVRAWIDSEDMGDLKSLPIPAKFSSWMQEYRSPFPILI